ncbi:L-threonylcarbamoyladenylate synthase [Thioalkalivibrio sp. HK1]|uniref:L-threonylcarbamoyladenylate synthase n=1 Tax=Thioalkalivibrio sp. HK1 TaxID=1469245 RepID=UPI0004728360|nr:L-threonylcarbamoyladenylate synthase [Thioalkalivibrio sp. HK1]
MGGWHYRRAIEVLRRGGIIAYPTEAVFGLGCDPLNRSAVARIFAVKRRSAHKRCILIAATVEQLAFFTDTSDPVFAEHAARSWPGPVTLVVRARRRVPTWLVGEEGSIALRVSDHLVPRALCSAFGGALISTSANRSSKAPVREISKARLAFGTDIDCYVKGRVGGLDRPTRIIDIRSGSVLRS